MVKLGEPGAPLRELHVCKELWADPNRDDSPRAAKIRRNNVTPVIFGADPPKIMAAGDRAKRVRDSSHGLRCVRREKSLDTGHYRRNGLVWQSSAKLFALRVNQLFFESLFQIPNLLRHFREHWQVLSTLANRFVQLVLPKNNETSTLHFRKFQCQVPIEGFMQLAQLRVESNVLFGSGSTAAVALHQLTALGVEVSRIFDNNQSKWGTKFFDRPIEKPSQTSQIVLIATDSAKTVGKQLKAMGNSFVYAGPLVDYASWNQYFSEIPASKFSYLSAHFTDKHSLAILRAIAAFRSSSDPTSLIESSFPHYAHPSVRLAAGDTIVDAGAWIGDSAQLFSKAIGPMGHIICFEPNADSAAQIKTANTVVHAAALSRKSGFGTLSSREPAWSGANASGHFVTENADGVIDSGMQVRLVALDDLNLTRCDALKMDIEGSELDALAGAENTIRAHKPKLMLSAYHRHGDLWEIPEKILEIAPYQFFLGHHSEAATETVLYGKPA